MKFCKIQLEMSIIQYILHLYSRIEREYKETK